MFGRLAGGRAGSTNSDEGFDTWLAGISALLVEDEPLIGRGIEAALTAAGAKVNWVRTDAAAYRELSNRGSFNLLIADINLGPGTTGFDVARYARRIEPQLPVIHLSGETPISVTSFAVPGAVLLVKPFAERELLRTAVELVKPAQPILCQPQITR